MTLSMAHTASLATSPTGEAVRGCIKALPGCGSPDEIALPALDYANLENQRPALPRRDSHRRSYGFATPKLDFRGPPLSSPLFDPSSNAGILGLGMSDESPADAAVESSQSEAMSSDVGSSLDLSTLDDDEERLSHVPALPIAIRNITSQQLSLDWAAPDEWGTTPSPKTPPIPFSERRLSESLRKSQSIAWTLSAPSPPGQSSGDRRPGIPTFRSLKAPLKRIVTKERSDSYASFFSFSASPQIPGSPSTARKASEPERTPRVRNSRSLDLR